MLHYQFRDREEGYYFDKISINTNQTIRVLKELFPKEHMAPEAYQFLISPASKLAKFVGFKTRIDVVAPTTECMNRLEVLNTRQAIAKISHIEIARDEFCKTKSDAEFCFNSMTKTLRKKYTPYNIVLDYSEIFTSNKDKKLFSDNTGYFGKETFRLVIYPRRSKINNNPVLHSEWRIRGASLIRKKTGIRTISDLTKFNFIEFFDRSEDILTRHEEIDQQKLGKWLLGWGRRKIITRRDRLKIGATAAWFCLMNNIESYQDLVSTLMKSKKYLKSKPGRKSSWERKILGLKNYGIFRDRIII
jgi:hypothetical protein